MTIPDYAARTQALDSFALIHTSTELVTNSKATGGEQPCLAC
jgi:hypothetical protein